ncbi:MAG: beta-lactamase family protein [Planctomycetes bacterium]|nr:beta-lactamase family protein [Planctomycetota bacterium]
MKMLCLMALAMCPVFAVGQVSAEAKDRVDRFLESAMSQMYIPGLTLAVVKDGELVKSAAYGVANVEYDVATTTDTLFLLASITKVFTATCVLMLVEDGKLDLDASIATYLDDAPDAWHPITVRMLLQHTAGLSDRWEEQDRSKWRLAYPTSDLYEAAKATPLEHEPGSTWQYSDQGFFLLGMIVERVSGRSYGDFLRARVFDPADMPRSRLTSQTDVIENLAQGYAIANRHWIKNHRRTDYGVVSHFGILSTAEELAAFDRALMSGELVQPQTLATMWKPATTAGEGRPTSTFGTYGLGWFLDAINGHRIVHHGGSTGTEYLKLPDDGLTVIVLTNLEQISGGNATLLARTVAQAWIDGLSWSDLPALDDPDPALGETVVAELAHMAEGTMDEDKYTEAFARAITPTLPAQKAGLAPLGPVTRCEYVGGSDDDGMRLARYRVVFDALPLYATLQVDAAGLVASFKLEQDTRLGD